MLKLTKTVFFVSALALTGCASMDPTPYQMASEKGAFGYTHKKLTDNQYRVSFRGNRKTDKDTIRDYALLHAADLTLEQSYDWFYISNRDMETTSKTVQSTRGGVSVTTSRSTSCGLLGCTTVHHPHYTGSIVESEERTRDHVNTLNITMGKGKPADPNSVYDASALAKNLRASLH